MATVRQRVRDSKKCFIHAHAFFRFMQSVPTSHKHGTAELAFRAIRMESRMSGESAAPFTCTLRACSRDRRCAHDDGAPHVAAHMNARALAASTVTSQPARIEGNRRPRMPHFTPWLSRRLRSTRRTIAAIRVRSDPIHVLRADGPRYVLARPIRTRRSSFVVRRSSRLLPSHMPRASLVGAPRSASQPGPRSPGHRYASSRERA